MTERFDWRARARSFRFAARGVRAMVVHEHNARIHLAVTACVLVLAVALGVGRLDWALLGLAVALVWIAEASNSAVEALADALHPDDHALIERAKDMAAGGVLIASILAGATGFAVLGPPLWRRMFGG